MDPDPDPHGDPNQSSAGSGSVFRTQIQIPVLKMHFSFKDTINVLKKTFVLISFFVLREHQFFVMVHNVQHDNIKTKFLKECDINF